MSAFIVQPKTINRVLAYLNMDRRGIKSQAARALQPLGHGIESDEALAALGQAMADLNTAAVAARYGEREFNPYVYAFESPGSLVQAYKSLGCWHYQCSEGDVPETPLYRALDEIYTAMAHAVASDAPGYDVAVWG